MKILVFVFFCATAVFFNSCLGESEPEPPMLQQNDEVYIVYMGAAAPSSNGVMRKDQAQLITSLLKRKRNALVYTYINGFTGFSARLTAEEARSIAQNPGVVSVFPDPILKLQTTRSWDFLDSISYKKISPTSLHKSTTVAQPLSSSEVDTIIGLLDAGIWPESPSFNDDGMGPIPARWKGKCEKGYDFNSSNCNRKIIGARYYPGSLDKPSARDSVGHGTHVASTAAGSVVDDASYFGQAKGTARGGSPRSRIAVYKVCLDFGCPGSTVLKAFEDAMKDGVDILSVSLGMFKNNTGYKPNFSTDPIAIGAFHAMERGIVVVCPGGHYGPYPSSVRNEAPWILTVAASTIDRDFQSHLILGDSTIIKGGGIHFSGKLDRMPLATGASVKSEFASEEYASDCLPQSLDPAKATGKIIICETHIQDYYSRYRELEMVRVGARGIVLIVNKEERLTAYKFVAFPGSTIIQKEANQVFSYLNYTRNPVATILPTTTVTGYKPAPAISHFSSKGPSPASLNLLKPDISAPGVDILGAWINGSYNLDSGTSIACPQTSGIVATVKAQNPNFSVSAIRSAVMTTATQTNNLNAPMTTTDGAIATPYDYGAGELNPTAALNPGLVYETEIADYLQFLCTTGYNTAQIRLISSTVPKGFKCPKKLAEDAISSINYPSIAVSKLKQGEPKTITRTVSNVGPEESVVYTATIEAMANIQVTVNPNKLVFTKQEKKLSYTLTFTASSSLEKDIFGSITWTSSGKYRVTSPIVVAV